jgi:hypothetical protein
MQYNTDGMSTSTYDYFASVNDAAGMAANTPTYTLSIKEAPIITAQPPNFSICPGGTGFLYVQVPSGANYRYQWYTANNGQPVSGETYMNIWPSPSSTTNYYCILTDPVTFCATQSSTASVIVRTPPASLPNITNTSWSPGGGPDPNSQNVWVEIDDPNDGSSVYYSITNTYDHAYDVTDHLADFSANYAIWPPVGYGLSSIPAGAITVSCYRTDANGCSSSQTFWTNPTWTPTP